MRNNAEILVKFVKNLQNFTIVTEIDGNYQNIGATIIDGILQAGISYKSTVKPRVTNFLQEYSEIKTTQEFKQLYDKVTVPVLINWKQSVKTERIENLTEFLIKEGVNTENEFKEWLNDENNIAKLKTLSGIKDKTADYFKILTGHDTNAIDRHLIGFLEKAGIATSNYQQAQDIISEAALLLDIQESFLDHSIWKYMSEAGI